MSHFASRLGLDLASVRGIPEKRDDRIKRLSRLVTPGPDARDAEIAALKARVAELEAALAAATATAKPTATAKKLKPATDNRNAKPKDEPWKALGLSERTYYRRKAAGTL